MWEKKKGNGKVYRNVSQNRALSIHQQNVIVAESSAIKVKSGTIMFSKHSFEKKKKHTHSEKQSVNTKIFTLNLKNH